MKKTILLSVACACLLGLSVHTGERLSIKVSPHAAMAPAAVTVRTTIEPSEDNRTLEVVAQSDSYYRSSQMTVDGDRAPRTTEWVYKGLPAGSYVIAATLVDKRGARSTVTHALDVAPGVNSR